MLCVKRRVAVRQKLQKIGRSSDAFKRGEDVPEVSQALSIYFLVVKTNNPASLYVGTFYKNTLGHVWCPMHPCLLGHFMRVSADLASQYMRAPCVR
jgi:hypothetical protein